MNPSDIRAAVEEADRRIRPHVPETPLRRSDYLSRITGAEVLCKLENLQVTGSFKARGAANKLAMIPAAARERGIVAASSGNHGAAVAAMLARMGGRALVFVPETTPSVKVEAMTAYGAEIRREGTDSGLCEVAARDYAAANGLVYVSPYNDPDVIAGQGTIGAEIERQAPGADMVVVSVGGGGLISGIAGHLKASNPGLQVIGAAPENDHSMLLSVKAGRAVAHEGSAPTLSDGTAGSVEPGAITVPLCATLVDEWVVVSEGEIAEAMRRYMAHDAQLIEGAAALAVAAFLKLAAARPEAVRGRSVIIVICGARIDLAKLVSIIGGQAG